MERNHTGACWYLEEVDKSWVLYNILCTRVEEKDSLNRSVVDLLLRACSDAPITPNFPSGSSREIVGDYVEK